ncbi:MAG: FliA/WhiG family RNA polymerase sigma factor [Desulfobacterales bacterium]|nr:FliA/WhiG family RNA polymerase sigma factor [Desulfobacterales bacterium]
MNEKSIKPELHKKSKNINSKERENLILKYAYLVKYIAGRIATRVPKSVGFDELLSAGSLGLIDAIDKYDPEKNVTIKTYAEYRIKGAILDELRSMDWYSRSDRKKIHEIENASLAIESRTGKQAEDYEIAKELGIDIENYFKTLGDIHSAALLSLDEYIKNDPDTKQTFKDKILSKSNPDEVLEYREIKNILADTINKLSHKEKLVISLYYYEELTLKEIGNILDLTESRISQLHTKSILKLKARLKAYFQNEL